MTSTVQAASSTLVMNKMTVITIIVRPCRANWLMPSWMSCWRFSMSLVMRLMSTPAFSSVKKSMTESLELREDADPKVVHDSRGELARDVDLYALEVDAHERQHEIDQRADHDHQEIAVAGSMPCWMAYSVRSGPACSVRLMMMTRAEPATTHLG